MTDITPTALITGGSKGIGYGIAQVRIKQGIRLAVTSRSQANADAAAAALNEIKPGFALGLEADVRSLVSQQQARDKLMQRRQRLDYVIANAGVGHFAPIQEMTPQQWQVQTTDSGHEYAVAENHLNRDFSAQTTGQKWVSQSYLECIHNVK